MVEVLEVLVEMVLMSDERTNPRWEIINKLYDKLDSDIIDIAEHEKMNFIEISLTLHMINKKISYEEFKAMLEFNMSNDTPDKKDPEGMYR